MINHLKPERVFYYFEQLTKIPRCSYDEQRISDYLKDTAQKLGLEVIQDEALNIIIKKGATPGYENKPTVVLQGHMDMVCERSDDSNFDFSKDSLKLHIDGDFLIAKETTLGADNGIAVAMCLALLESKDIAHPPLEVLVTSNEESGMTGANELDPKNISGRILINIDSEEEGTILVSCAGGERNIISIDIKWNEVVRQGRPFLLRVSGLQGGHSGMEINKGRGNSNVIMARILNSLNQKMEYDLAYIDGGSKSNAIPRLSTAKLVLYSDIEEAKKIVDEFERQVKEELASSDNDVTLRLEPIEMMDRVFASDVKDKIIAALMLIPNGVQSMSMDIEDLVESSNNLGVVKTINDNVTIECAMRSSVGSLKLNISEKIKMIAHILDCKWESTSAYPAWEYKQDSYIREVFKKSYKELYGEDLQVAAIHAGLECGLFKEKFGDIDMVSFGPNMEGVHAPGEKLSISSTERSWVLLKKVLENI